MNPTPLTLAEQRDLLRDCLRLWEVEGQVVVDDNGVSVMTAEGAFTLMATDPDLRPVRWFLKTPDRHGLQEYVERIHQHVDEPHTRIVRNGQTALVWAKQTILASGGAGMVYRETTNPPMRLMLAMSTAMRASTSTHGSLA